MQKITKLLEVGKTVVSRHTKNIFKDKEVAHAK